MGKMPAAGRNCSLELKGSSLHWPPCPPPPPPSPQKRGALLQGSSMPLPSVSPWGLCSERFPQIFPQKGRLDPKCLSPMGCRGEGRSGSWPAQSKWRPGRGSRLWLGSWEVPGTGTPAWPQRPQDRQFWKAGGTYSRRCCGPPGAGGWGAPCGHTVFFPGRALSASTEPGTQEA